MKIAICEDNPEDCSCITRILQEYMNGNGYISKIDIYETAEKFINCFIPELYEIIFLDIYLNGMTGIEAAKLIRDKDPHVAIVFITVSCDHALDAFSVRASAYVTKPVTSKDMHNALKQCQHIFIKNARFIEVVSKRRKIKIPVVKIMYIETYGRETVIHTENGDIKTTMPILLNQLEQSLGSSFLRCHRSYIVNMNHIREITAKDIILTNGDKVPLRQRGRSQIYEKYGEFLSARLFEEVL